MSERVTDILGAVIGGGIIGGIALFFLWFRGFDMGYGLIVGTFVISMFLCFLALSQTDG